MLTGPHHCPVYKIQGNGPLLIYVAGLDGTGELFFKQVPDLSRFYRVVTYRSRDGSEFTYDDLTRDLAAIVEDQGENSATIVGESFGGTIAISFALEYPQRVDRLVIVNSFPRFRRRMTIGVGIWVSRLLPFKATWFLRKAFVAIGLWADRIARQDWERIYQALRTVTKESYVRRLQLIAEVNLINRLREITAPTLLIAGGNDLLIPSAREAQIMADRIPNAAIRIVEGAGHACLLGGKISLATVLADWKSSEAVSSKPDLSFDKQRTVP